jgi:HK97 family phage major capsid protein
VRLTSVSYDESDITMWQKMKQLREERAQFLGQMKAILKKADDEKRSITAEEDTHFNDLNAKAEERKVEIERYERAQALEAELAAKGEQRAGREDVNTPEAREADKAKEQRAQFDSYLRTGVLPSTETRALTVSGAGVVGDRAVYNTLVTSLKTFAGVREAGATILPTTDGNDLTIPKSDDTSNTGQIVSEATEDNTEADPTLASVTLKAYRFDSKWVKVSLEMLQDASYPLESYILGIAGERIGRAFNNYATTGTGTGEPKGILTAATLGKTAASQTAITYDELLDFVHSIDAGYRNSPNFKLMLHDTTLAAIRKLKDNAGSYIFSAGAAGAPARVLDIPYVVNNAMPQLTSGTGSKVIAGGDFGRYFVRDVTGVTVVRANELFVGSGLVGFRVFSRHDANLTDANALKYLKLA